MTSRFRPFDSKRSKSQTLPQDANMVDTFWPFRSVVEGHNLMDYSLLIATKAIGCREREGWVGAGRHGFRALGLGLRV